MDDEWIRSTIRYRRLVRPARSAFLETENSTLETHFRKLPRMPPSLDHENELRRRGHRVVRGIDEAGGGPLSPA